MLAVAAARDHFLSERGLSSLVQASRLVRGEGSAKTHGAVPLLCGEGSDVFQRDLAALRPLIKYISIPEMQEVVYLPSALSAASATRYLRT